MSSCKLNPAPAQVRLRIIGGSWRGRKLVSPGNPQLRPTPDRVRETLFNWLQPVIHSSRCLDLFAGSGALGFEALSRGATRVDFVEQDHALSEVLGRNADTLRAREAAAIHCSDAFDWLAKTRNAYDIVFLDPPFGTEMINDAMTALVDGNHLNPAALVYTEAAKNTHSGHINLKEYRQSVAGEVQYRLLKF